MEQANEQAGPGQRRRLTRVVLAAVAVMLAGCNDAHRLSGPSSPRDGAGPVVDPMYGTPIPGTPAGNGGV
jgi:hypothetical protein